jgi:uncharacterized protein with PIN domain
MLGKLTRFLRIFGYDTVYANDLIDLYGIDPVPDEKLNEFAGKSKRIIITKDLPFYNMIRKKAILLEGEGIYNYLNQLKSHLKLEYEFKIKNARCSVCNSIIKKVCNKNSIKKLVKNETFKNYDDFYQCESPNCQKVFWNGPHIADIIKNLRNKENY